MRVKKYLKQGYRDLRGEIDSGNERKIKGVAPLTTRPAGARDMLSYKMLLLRQEDMKRE